MAQLKGFGRSNGCAFADSPGPHADPADGERVAAARARRPVHRGADRRGETASTSSATRAGRSTCSGTTSSSPASGSSGSERPAGRAAAGCRLPGHDHRLLELDGGRRRPADLRTRRRVQLRQGPARTGRPGQPRLPGGRHARRADPQHGRGRENDPSEPRGAAPPGLCFSPRTPPAARNERRGPAAAGGQASKAAQPPKNGAPGDRGAGAGRRPLRRLRRDRRRDLGRQPALGREHAHHQRRVRVPPADGDRDHRRAEAPASAWCPGRGCAPTRWRTWSARPSGRRRGPRPRMRKELLGPEQGRRSGKEESRDSPAGRTDIGVFANFAAPSARRFARPRRPGGSCTGTPSTSGQHIPRHLERVAAAARSADPPGRAEREVRGHGPLGLKKKKKKKKKKGGHRPSSI